MRNRLISQANRLFLWPFVEAHNKEIIEVPHNWLSMWRIHQAGGFSARRVRDAETALMCCLHLEDCLWNFDVTSIIKLLLHQYRNVSGLDDVAFQLYSLESKWNTLYQDIICIVYSVTRIGSSLYSKGYALSISGRGIMLFHVISFQLGICVAQSVTKGVVNFHTQHMMWLLFPHMYGFAHFSGLFHQQRLV